MDFFGMTKINTTFAAMKSRRNIVFRIVFLLTIFFCVGMNAQSNYSVRLINIEHPVSTNNEEKSFTSDSDCIDEDQIDKSFGIASTDKQMQQILNQKSYFIADICSVSVWQPPKVF
jgi:hypothetical protein